MTIRSMMMRRGAAGTSVAVPRQSLAGIGGAALGHAVPSIMSAVSSTKDSCACIWCSRLLLNSLPHIYLTVSVGHRRLGISAIELVGIRLGSSTFMCIRCAACSGL